MQINLRLCYVLVIMIYVHFLQAQSSITSAGGAGVGTGGKLSFSVGQTTYNYTSSATATLSEGVHQPYEISIITQSPNTMRIELSIAAFPDVTVNYLTLKIENQAAVSTLSYQLIDMNGLLLECKQDLSSETLISLNNYPTATYILKVTQDSKEIKLIRIIKK